MNNNDDGRNVDSLPSPLPTELTWPRGAYVHVPFCRHRCGYCNFTLVAGRDDLIPRFLSALQLELVREATGQPRDVETLFFGGGTPTHLPAADLDKLLALVRSSFPLATGGEFSVEANPLDLLDAERLAVLRSHGVTRINLGVQSFSPRKLELLERDHRPADIATAFAAARSVADSVGLDLIFGTPGETLAEWQHDLQAALKLGPDHLSTYGLTWERGTQFWSRLQRGELRTLDEETERQQYESAIDGITSAGLEHYEVSNFARAGHRCRHNETYWLGNEYFAVGPGAARYVRGIREVNHRSTTKWLERVLAGESAVAEREELAPEDRARERFVFALRRLEGIAIGPFEKATGFRLEELAGEPLHRFAALGLLKVDSDNVRLTRQGLLVSDALWPEFLRV